jgi:Rps23 Pro-64 3,4-dihydroxylase Tpa1-like proline 4-hydroxylase
MSYLHWCDFLDDDLIALLRSTVVDQRDRFVPTTVTSGEPDYRKSMVLWHHDCRPLYNRFIARLRLFMPDFKRVFPKLPDHPQFELQVTSHGDGDYFRRHTDNGCPQTSRRIVTYVYYFTLTDEPQFTGGDLILETDEGEFAFAPKHNTIILFPSSWWHEVRPVSLPSGHWEDRRLTVNGWMA